MTQIDVGVFFEEMVESELMPRGREVNGLMIVFEYICFLNFCFFLDSMVKMKDEFLDCFGYMMIVFIHFIPFQHGEFEIMGGSDIFQITKSFSNGKTVADAKGYKFFEG